MQKIKYLESILSENGKGDTEIQTRIGQAKEVEKSIEIKSAFMPRDIHSLLCHGILDNIPTDEKNIETMEIWYD